MLTHTFPILCGVCVLCMCVTELLGASWSPDYWSYYHDIHWLDWLLHHVLCPVHHPHTTHSMVVEQVSPWCGVYVCIHEGGEGREGEERGGVC